MGKSIKVKHILNKANNQINFNLPKKCFSKEEIKRIIKSKKLKISIDKIYLR